MPEPEIYSIKDIKNMKPHYKFWSIKKNELVCLLDTAYSIPMEQLHKKDSFLDLMFYLSDKTWVHPEAITELIAILRYEIYPDWIKETYNKGCFVY